MNKSKYINPEKCAFCGKCCKTFSIDYLKPIISHKNVDMGESKQNELMLSEVQRFKDLKSNEITVTEKEDRFIVTFNCECKYLTKINNKFRCAIYDKDRPKICLEYPYEDTIDCPHKKDL